MKNKRHENGRSENGRSHAEETLAEETENGRSETEEVAREKRKTKEVSVRARVRCQGVFTAHQESLISAQTTR